MNIGPQLPISEEIGRDKHRQKGETFEDAMRRIAKALADDREHELALVEILLDQRFLPAGRVQSAAGSFRTVTAYNCFVSGTIPDSMEGIMDLLKESALTMQKGGGIGYNFSTIRPRGDLIKSLDSQASGPLSFMEPFDATCGTVASAGNRRGAQMGVLNITHPDIRAFIEAKGNNDYLRRFNISIGVSDEFMEAVRDDEDFDLRWGGKVYETVRARELWERVMEMTWDWAEPGILFLDRINNDNNLWYCEEIAATNPCGEQPLPPYGACLLGSFNWAKYVYHDRDHGYRFNYEQLAADIPQVVAAMDNVVDRTIYPLPQQEAEAKAKRRMGLGATGVANAMEALGLPYASEGMKREAEKIQQMVTNECYRASAHRAREKEPFPLFSRHEYCNSVFIQKLDPDVQDLIWTHGIRNSHLTSIAPTGSISLAADNVSSGIEPPFMLEFDRTIQEFDGEKVEKVSDYAYREWGIAGRTANELTPQEHVDVLVLFQRWVDSACSKTCNIGNDVTFDEFKDVYMSAWLQGAKGCTTFRVAGKRFGIFNAAAEEEPEEPGVGHNGGPPLDDEIVEGAACYIDPATGKKSCE